MISMRPRYCSKYSSIAPATSINLSSRASPVMCSWIELLHLHETGSLQVVHRL